MKSHREKDTEAETLFLMQGQSLKARKNDTHSAYVRLVRDDNDISMCNQLCKSSYGFSREMELHDAKDQGVASMIERGGVRTGYAASMGILCHAVAMNVILIVNMVKLT